MKTIQLTRMSLRNFKGVESADYDFSQRTDIRGGNATGKSTIYEAYLWCLFDKNQQGGTPKVQPLDKNNEVRHQLTTTVTLNFLIDNAPFIVSRSLKEKWVKPNGKTELICQGTTSDYAINEVPLSKTQFTAKLTEILPLDKWFMISNIAIIPNMDQKACRAALQSIAPTVNERTLAEQFPAVLYAFDKGLTIDEIAAGIKQNKSRAKQELDGIPAALDAQDRLRVDEEWDILETNLNITNKNIEQVNAEIASLQRADVSEEDLQRKQEQMREYNELLAQIAERERQLHQDELNDQYSISQESQKVGNEIAAINARTSSRKSVAEVILTDIKRYQDQIAGLRQQWLNRNNEQYQEPAIATTCPTCGQPLPIERVEAARTKAREQWNTQKATDLAAIQKQAEAAKARIDELKKQNAEAEEQSKTDTARLDELNATMQDLYNRKATIATTANRLAADEIYQDLIKKREQWDAERAAEAEKANDADKQEREAQIKELQEELATCQRDRDEILKRLSGKDTNRRIDEERSRLEKRQAELADTIARYEGEEAQIAAFRKAKITAIEQSVSSLFQMVYWKMYEPNLTNDGEKEICQPMIQGIPYDQQNLAMQYNAAIDIVNGFATAYGVSAPLFIDNAESVTDLLQTDNQRITLTVQAGAELNIINN